MKTTRILILLSLTMLQTACLIPLEPEDRGSYLNRLTRIKAEKRLENELERIHGPRKPAYLDGGVWQKHSDQPLIFKPTGYPGRVNSDLGEFIFDQRDGKRFFVPATAVNGYNSSVLRADAIKHLK